MILDHFLRIRVQAAERVALVKLLKELRDCFAWSYTEMPGLDPNVAVQHLAIDSKAKPVKQVRRKFGGKTDCNEVKKLFAAKSSRR